ncbi:hypothetical protein LAWI1_G002019, partial [Lachnellula willkommii]
ALFRKNYVFLGVVFASAFAFEMYVKLPGNTDAELDLMGHYRSYDNVMDKVWDGFNKGRQWKDIRAKYVEAGGDDE